MKEPLPSQGSDIVLRGLVLLALLIVIVLAGFAIFFRRPSRESSSVAPEPEKMVSLLVQPVMSFPATFSWGVLFSFADNLPSSPGWRIRYSAARNLAFRGSSAVPWEVYQEMLDEHRQFCNFRVRAEDGKLLVEEGAARQIMIGALRDLAAWHEKQQNKGSPPGKELRDVYATVDKLTHSPILELRTQAEKTSAVFFK